MNKTQQKLKATITCLLVDGVVPKLAEMLNHGFAGCAVAACRKASETADRTRAAIQEAMDCIFIVKRVELVGAIRCACTPTPACITRVEHARVRPRI